MWRIARATHRAAYGEESWRWSLPRRLDIVSAFYLFFYPKGLILWDSYYNPLDYVLNKPMWCCKCELCLWYSIEMSFVCDSYWSRDYHDNTASRVRLLGTRSVSRIVWKTCVVVLQVLQSFGEDGRRRSWGTRSRGTTASTPPREERPATDSSHHW